MSGSASTVDASPVVVVCSHCRRKNRVPAVARGAPRCANCHRALPWVVDADDATFEQVADEATIPVLVDVWATWCAPCRMVSPVLVGLAAEMAGRFKLVKVDADRAPRVSARFDARAIPTLVLMHHGVELARQVGAAPEHLLRTWLQEALPQE